MLRTRHDSSGNAGWLRRYGLALAVNLLAMLLTWLLLPYFSRTVFIFFFAAVAINAWYGGIGPSILTILTALVTASWLAFPRAGGLRLAPEGLFALAGFTATACLISGLTEARRRAELRARAEGARFRVTLASIGDAVVVVDSAARVTFINAVAETLTGWTQGQAAGRPAAEVLLLADEPSGQPAESPIAAVLRDGQRRELANHTCLTARDGTRRPIADSAAPIRADSGEIIGVVMVFRDMTERAQADAARAELLAREQVARQVAEQALGLRDQFLSLAAHELKTPLTSVIGNIQLLQRRFDRSGILSEREQRMLQIVADQTQRLHTMVLSLLDVSRIEAGQLAIARAPTDIAALAHQVASEVQLGRPERRIAVEVADAPLMVSGDALRLEQVFQNLLQNALKYSEPATLVTLSLRRLGAEVAVAVRDQGIGIPAESLPHLFERFYRASNAAHSPISGLGIGLAVVREIVALHGGRVAVESAEGQGSTFTVFLPALEKG
jgi:PAS domain S-box-containing protein